MEFKDLKGKTLTSISVSDDKYSIVFITSDDERFMLYHEQDCCENVEIEDICGDLGDLINSPIVVAEEVVNEPNINPVGVPVQEYQESFTWTFYKLDTVRGGVTIRWYGESNGYYSESVEFSKIENNNKLLTET